PGGCPCLPGRPPGWADPRGAGPSPPPPAPPAAAPTERGPRTPLAPAAAGWPPGPPGACPRPLLRPPRRRPPLGLRLGPGLPSRDDPLVEAHGYKEEPVGRAEATGVHPLGQERAKGRAHDSRWEDPPGDGPVEGALPPVLESCQRRHGQEGQEDRALGCLLGEAQEEDQDRPACPHPPPGRSTHPWPPPGRPPLAAPSARHHPETGHHHHRREEPAEEPVGQAGREPCAQ